MRLVNVKTFELVEFMGEKLPCYAILSHRWGDQEVSLRDLETGDWLKRDDKRGGRDKIIGCCAATAAEGFDFAWIDTCCIDKTSSAELSEAINSMFQWYHRAVLCFAYLHDVEDSQDPSAEDSDFAQSKWFTRGWTLQELLAPYEVVFLGREWAEIGTKTTLQDLITSITGICTEALADRSFSKYSVAQKMSWAAERQTTRSEDLAYCLLGLFDVNMPLLYGEGQGAFFRLQEDIMKRIDDESIFAWTRPSHEQTQAYIYRTGLLAPSPALFIHCSEITIVDKGTRSLYRGVESTEDYLNPFEFVRQHVRVRRPVLGPLSAMLLTTLDPILGRSLQRLCRFLAIDDVFTNEVESESSARGGILEGAPNQPKQGKLENKIKGVDIMKTPGLSWMWRFYSDEPITIIPLMCCFDGMRLGLLLSRTSNHYMEDSIFHRVHYPSLICIEDITKFTKSLSPLQNLYVSSQSFFRPRSAYSPSFDPPPLEVRIVDLVEKGYICSREQGSSWSYDRRSKKLIRIWDILIPNSSRNILIFRHKSGDWAKHPTFFLASGIDIDRPVVGILDSSLQSPEVSYQAWQVELKTPNRVEVKLVPSEQALVLKWRNMERLKYLNLSIEPCKARPTGMPVSSSALVPAVFDNLKRRLQRALSNIRAREV